MRFSATPLSLDSALGQLGNEERGMLVDQASPCSHGAPSFLLKDPVSWITVRDSSSLPQALRTLEGAGRNSIAGGWLAYELGYGLDSALEPCPSGPSLLEFGIYDKPAPVATVGRPLSGREDSSLVLKDFRFDMEKERYCGAVRNILEKIREGDVYQANLTIRLFFRFSGDPRDLYLRLRPAQPVANSMLIRNRGEWILSLSPELFFHLRGERVTVQPMKGTSPRGRTGAEDEALMRALSSDEKNRAENLMIVDLMRNDLGRVAGFGTVEAERLFEVRPYPTVLQMVSTVSATIRDGVCLPDLLRALFPSGSVTGAPKIAAMKLIRRLETGPRGVYCGALGWMAGQEATFNVGIRTIHLRRTDGPGQLEPHGEYAGVLGIGSGIVADSVPESEWDEILLKGKYLTAPPPSFCLLESLRFESGFPFLEMHLKRLSRSAGYFGFPFDRVRIETALRDHAGRLPGNGVFKVRLLVDPSGEIRVTSRGADRPSEPVRIRLAGQATDPKDRFLYHKTTHRPLYDAAQRAAREYGCWDLIFCNSLGFVTEGSISNIFVLHQGRWLTPPLECGLLGGVSRQEMIARLGVEERAFKAETLLQAEEVLVSNAVQGPLRARVMPGRVHVKGAA
jgi:para-aminobenzoate synthetase / 4-amino-4-deoxychorismate lyase